MAALPVTLIGGYLGAGKTTLVNRLLRENGGRRLAVLVNDFGDINIDADLIEAQDDSIISLSGGCVCCSFGSDLMSTLASVVEGRANFDHLLIETSGVALPAAVARAVRLVPELQLEATLVLADALTVREQASDRYVGDMIRMQLSQADLILLNKVDLISDADRVVTAEWLSAQVPGATVITTQRAEGVPALVFSAWPVAQLRAPSPSGLLSAQSGRSMNPVRAASARERFMSLAFQLDHAIDAHKLASLLTRPALHLLRAKGVVRGAHGVHHQFQLVGTRTEVVPLRRPTPVDTQLVVIGLAGQLNRDDLLTAIAACRLDHDKIGP